GLDEVAQGHQLEAELLDRLEDLAVLTDRRAVAGEGHGGEGGPIEVGVEQADLGARLLQRDGEVEGDGALAHSTLAGADQDDVTHPRQELIHAAGPGRLAHAGAPLDLEGGERLDLV